MEVVRQEGEVRLSGRGLPGAPGQHYVLWLTREGSGDADRLGEPRVRPDGTLVLDLVLPEDIPDRGWNLALLTVEDSATPSHPGPRHSMAGRFPQLPSNGPGTVPSNLPNTGMGGGATPGVSSIFTAVAIAVAFGVLVSLLALRAMPHSKFLPGGAEETPLTPTRSPRRGESGSDPGPARSPGPRSSPRDGEKPGERSSRAIASKVRDAPWPSPASDSAERRLS